MSEIDSEAGRTETAHDYFRAVEELFIERRGAPLLLSPADWRVAKKWYEDDIPLFVVEQALDEVFESRREREPEDRVNSLRYCDAAVRRWWRELIEMRGPAASRGLRGGEEDLDVDERLGELAGSLPADLPQRDEWADRIRTLDGSIDEIELQLGELERELVEKLLHSLSDEAREEVETEVEAALSRVRDRVSPEELGPLAARFRARVVRHRFGVDPLTLFG